MFKHLIDQCSFPKFKFIYHFSENTLQHTWGSLDNQHYLQVETDTIDVETGESVRFQGRKWKLSKHMTESEVVQTCFKAISTFIEHETRENFTYLNRRVFGPHIDVNKLWEICQYTDERTE